MISLSRRLDRWRRAWAYARGRLSEDEAHTMVFQIEAALESVCGKMDQKYVI